MAAAHLAVEPETGLITACALTKVAGAGPDGRPVSEPTVGLALLDGEDEPVTMLAYSVYGSGELRTTHGLPVRICPAVCSRLSASATSGAPLERLGDAML